MEKIGRNFGLFQVRGVLLRGQAGVAGRARRALSDVVVFSAGTGLLARLGARDCRRVGSAGLCSPCPTARLAPRRLESCRLTHPATALVPPRNGVPERPLSVVFGDH
jgi:hypothetical protein